VVAGVPPDYFSETGQLWGNPLYDWEAQAQTGYRWWIDRLKAVLDRFDAVRLDHFIGFARYWEVPAGAETAIGGQWRKGPGRALFDAANAELGEMTLIAEDLGIIGDDVIALRDGLALPAMRVLQFGFDEADSIHHPDRIPEAAVAYTGTHDNPTTVGWFAERSEHGRAHVLETMGTSGDEIHWDMIARAHRGRANTVIVPLQDIAGLDDRHRMNVPGRMDGNWGWRWGSSELPDEAFARLADITRWANRAS